MRDSVVTEFALNGWYAAAWTEEIGRTPLERWICGRPLLMYRTLDGRAVALDGSCPHRGFPLVRGTLQGDVIRCGYHGIAFDASGACAGVPGEEHVAAAMCVHAYPLVERGGLIWIWPGAADLADPATIVDRWLTDPAWVAVHDTKIVEGRQSLLIDNLMDLSHETYLHPDTLGNAVAETPILTESFPDHVRLTRMMLDIPPPGLFRKMGLDGTIDRGQRAEFHPPGLCLTIVHATPRNGGPTLRWTVMHMLTPETATRTRYLWATARDFALDDASIDDAWLTTTNMIFDQDAEAIAAQEQRLQELGESFRELSVGKDAGGLAARKLQRERLRAEQSAPSRVR